MAGQIRFELAPLGDTAVQIVWQGIVDQALINANLAVVRLIERGEVPGLVAAVPGFASLTIHYDPLAWSNWEQLSGALRRTLSELVPKKSQESRLVEIPVCYSEDHAPDLETVAALTGLTSREFARRHSEAEYTVRMLGFMPGFPYLAGLPEELQVPRKERPRLSVPAGSVAIGGNQTGIYPVVSPGGWQIIGRTPVCLFDPRQANPSLLQPGDRVQFRPVAPAEYLEIERAAG